MPQNYCNSPLNQHNENSEELLKNLVIYLAASENLVRNLRVIFESNMQSPGRSGGAAICACPGDSCQLVKKRTDLPIESAGARRISFDDTLQGPPVNPEEDRTPTSASPVYENEPAPVSGAQIEPTSEKQTPPPPNAIESTPLNVTSEDTKNVSDVDNEDVASVETIISEPKYEDVKGTKSASDTSKMKSCDCEAKVVKSQCMVMAAKSKTKQSAPRASKSRKSLGDKFVQEKKEKFAKLKESVSLAQKYLSDVQEQVRQLERLFQDYDSPATPEGQVNTARLYREIMKPQTVPYVPDTRSRASSTSMNRRMTPGMSSAPLNRRMTPGMTSPRGAMVGRNSTASGSPMRHASMQTKTTCCSCASKNSLGRVSVLSAVALEDDDVYF